MFQVVQYGNPILRKKAKPVTVFDDALLSFVKQMNETMIEYDGVGLAAPQVGNSIQLFVVDTTRGETPPIVVINPEFTYLSKEEEIREEGCLSFPDIHLNIKRPSIVSIKALDENGKEFIIENATELLARALQHENDHLNGILIIDHVSLVQRKMLSGKLKKIKSPDLDEKDQSKKKLKH